MIIFFNVKVTSNRIHHYRNYKNNNYPCDSRLDVFKYCLSSWASLQSLVTKFVIYLELDQEYADKRDEFMNYLRNLIPDEKLELYNYRLNFYSDWLSACENLSCIDDNVLCYCGNDDHIFIDSDTKLIEKSIEILNRPEDELSSIYYSHWLEQMKMSEYYQAELTDDGNFLIYDNSNYDAIQIMTKERFMRIWREACAVDHRFNSNNSTIYKSDYLLNYPPLLTKKTYVPTKEIVRHYDGYGHVIGDDFETIHNFTPSLFIPIGFFENNINIIYGYQNRDNSKTNLNPSSDFLYAEDSDGADYRWTLEDIPLFWKDKISNISTNNSDDIEYQNFLKKQRDHYLKKSLQVSLKPYCQNILENTFKNSQWIDVHLIGDVK
jgi:hypothetical protein